MPTRMFTYKNSLPQYFFGDQMNEDEKSDKSNYDDVHLSEPNLSRIPSPASSLASTKKLEWDSGADIGYIYDTRKSKSYPSLNMDSFKLTTSKIKTDKQSTEGAKIKSLSCMEEVKVQKKLKPKSFKHSTPLDYHRRRIMKSCGDSPINNEKKEKKCKEVQTDLFLHEDKSLQTEITDLLGPRHMCSTSSSSKHSSKNSSPKNSSSKNSSSKKSSSNNSSSKDSTSKHSTMKDSSKNSSTKSGSFKYIPGSEISDKSSLKNVESSGSCSPLGQMISTQYSKNLIDDIDKSLAILQKFIKSKDYSYDTKKHYAKKIVTKIINNRYTDDTSPESSQSELVDKKYVECGTQCDEITKKSQIISERTDCKIKESLEKLNALQTDLKNWRSAQTLSEKLFEARKSHTKQSSQDDDDDDGKRDYLLRHSKNERKRQLSWINNEISYLQKLKDLLQLNSTSNTSTNTATKTTSRSDVEDVEKKFNEEFGLLPPEKENVTLNKLSKLLSNEQIKFILEHDVHNTSYNSHKNSIYGGNKMAPLDVNDNKMASRDVATQYQTLIEKTSTSTSSADESIIIENAIEEKKFNNKGTAYFLTFEEESVSYEDSLEQKHLEQVVVKIPKYHSRTKTSSINRNENARTLEEHLLKNRPEFVRTANWRWTQVRPLDQERQSIFTCQEMMEMSRKKYNNLPEMQEKVKNYKTLMERRHNRFMQYIFSKKLQKKTLQGHICLATCRSVLSSE